MKIKLKIIIAIAVFSLGFSIFVYGTCYQASGGGEVIVSQIPDPCPVSPEQATSCQVVSCSVRWETTNQTCASINPSDTFGKTECNTSQTVPKRWTRRFGQCDTGGDPCFCSTYGEPDTDEIPGETVTRATLSGSDCGCAQA